MCVIGIYEKEKPTKEQLESMEMVNAHGGGLSWLEGGRVHYMKGLTAKEIYEISQVKDLPQVVHFRISTINGVSDELTHPFPITEKVELDLSGSCDKVLFHNGIWDEYEKIVPEMAQHNALKIPDGIISDSRMMAWVVYHLGENYLEFVTGFNKFAVMSKDGIRKYGEGWTSGDGTHLSNTNHESPVYDFGRGYESVQTFDNTHRSNFDWFDEYKEYEPISLGKPVHATEDWKKLNDDQMFNLMELAEEKGLSDIWLDDFLAKRLREGRGYKSIRKELKNISVRYRNVKHGTVKTIGKKITSMVPHAVENRSPVKNMTDMCRPGAPPYPMVKREDIYDDY